MKVCLVFAGVGAAVVGGDSKEEDTTLPWIVGVYVGTVSLNTARLSFLQRYLKDSKRDPLVSLLYLALVSVLVNSCAFAIFESSRFSWELVNRAVDFSAIGLSCTFAVMVNISAVFVITQTCSLSLSLFGTLKWIIITIGFASIFSVLTKAEEIDSATNTIAKIGPLQVFGYGVALISLFWYKEPAVRVHKLVFTFVALNLVCVFLLIPMKQVQGNPVFAERILIVNDVAPKYEELVYKYTVTSELANGVVFSFLSVSRKTGPSKKVMENTNQNKSTLDIVVAYYQEDIRNLHVNLKNFISIPALQARNPRVIIYVKGTRVNLKTLQKETNASEIRVVSNIGREGHTYLRHIYERYDNDKNGGGRGSSGEDVLADYTLFFQGSPDRLVTGRLHAGLNDGVGFVNVGEMMRNPYYGPDHQGFHWPLVKEIYKTFHNGEYPANGTFLTHTYLGQFVVSKKQILKNSKETYKVLIDKLEAGVNDEIHKDTMFSWFQQQYKKSTASNPVFGHSVERAWGLIFGCAGAELHEICMKSDSACRCMED
ncbi:hypothetical protein HK100_005112 [Physocladia obscura]|uniref:Uncharacterized protein n=1 Tax=Physocladia obscura TaxID=109957 RepID=A0AAD5SS36_9FUNG|nr:hypothetical protein HK100_005112 [Physocladia obscura]